MQGKRTGKKLLEEENRKKKGGGASGGGKGLSGLENHLIKKETNVNNRDTQFSQNIISELTLGWRKTKWVNVAGH